MMFAPRDGSSPDYLRQSGPELIAMAEEAYNAGQRADAEHILSLAYDAFDQAYSDKGGKS